MSTCVYSLFVATWKMFDTSQPAYQRLRKIYAERTRGLVTWVGSGLSRPAGLPTWPELRAKLVTEVQQKATSLGQPDAVQMMRRLEGVAQIADNWLAFDKLREILGQATFQAAIRDALTPRTNIDTPELYTLFWRLRIGGMMTLNLDRFAARAFVQVHHEVALHEMTGREAGERLHVLKSSAPFVVNLHGITEHTATWVLTRTDLSSLLNNPGYRTFIDSIFATKTILFAGISADDVAAGGLLTTLRAKGVDPGQHFWLTSRTDLLTDEWAEKSGIEVIRYTAEKDHATELSIFFADMAKFVPVDSEPPPLPVLVSTTIAGSRSPLPSPLDLSRQEPEAIRHTLAAHAKELLSASPAEAVPAYTRFRAEYQRAIYNAWYITLARPDNIVFGHVIESVVGTGAFATVYRATAPTGEIVALKVLRPEVGQDERMLGSFRRGVRSMRILSERGVTGTVSYREAYELPACTSMEFIEGPNLQVAVESGALDPIRDGLRIMAETARIVRVGHGLPEQVLHRDIRPANIMLRNFYSTPDNWDVVVLNFDLSWHRGATEKSIDLKAATALGYLAPEQVQAVQNVSTRSAAVDAFGLGMTMAYLFTGQHPSPGISSKEETWEATVRNRLLSLPETSWRSLPSRLARLVARATRILQVQRVDFGEIETELERLRRIVDDEHVESLELWAEEILARSYGPSEYQWNVDVLKGEMILPGGLAVTLKGDEIQQKVLLEVGWAFAGDRERKNVGKFLPTKVDQFVSRLRTAGWTVGSKALGTGTFGVEAHVGLPTLKSAFPKLVESLRTGSEIISF